jgi:flavorubredoxin
MKSIVVYESYWGNTASVARAIAEGIGAGAQAMTTTEATAKAVKDADLVVAGMPIGEAQRFIVKGKFGPLLDGELEKARKWGAELAKAMG